MVNVQIVPLWYPESSGRRAVISVKAYARASLDRSIRNALHEHLRRALTSAGMDEEHAAQFYRECTVSMSGFGSHYVYFVTVRLSELDDAAWLSDATLHYYASDVVRANTLIEGSSLQSLQVNLTRF